MRVCMCVSVHGSEPKICNQKTLNYTRDVIYPNNWALKLLTLYLCTLYFWAWKLIENLVVQTAGAASGPSLNLFLDDL